MMPTSGFFPNSTSISTTKPSCAECKRLLKVLESMRALPLNQRVSYVYQGLINEALEGGK